MSKIRQIETMDSVIFFIEGVTVGIFLLGLSLFLK